MTHSNSKVLWISGLLSGFTFVLALSVVPAFAQDVPDATVAAALSNLGSRAGVVFAGEVTAIRCINDVVEIDFHVDQNVKAANAGSYTMREWSGLWAAGQRRYWIGERAIVFLNPVGKSGLSSSVDGMEGILPILPNVSDVLVLVVDVQRLRTRVLRAAGAPMVDSVAQMSFAQVASAVITQSNNPSATPVSYPTDPISGPVAPPVFRPIQSPTLTAFPNPMLGPAQNSVVLVMNSDETDDFLSTDDAEPKHKKTKQPDGTR